MSYTKDDFQIHGNVMVIKYSKIDYNRHEHGFEKGVQPLFEHCRKNSVDTVILNMEEITFVESMELGSIIKFKKQIEEIGVTNIKICNPSPTLEDTIKMQNLDQIFGEPFKSVEDALKATRKQANGDANAIETD